MLGNSEPLTKETVIGCEYDTSKLEPDLLVVAVGSLDSGPNFSGRFSSLTTHPAYVGSEN